ncbi:MAG TPA: hypothetical protein VFX84_03865 [Candidatus Saccharimonadales bacterium]|nr:hypothetical protein [Candidatus Saccharimonadales bacterium]
MKRLILTLVMGALITFGAPSTALAAGGTYFPPVGAPAKAKPTPKAATKKTAAPASSCTGEIAPEMTVYSPSENPVEEDQAGGWTLYLYSPRQDSAKWAVFWTGTPGITYDFEVSSSSATDPATGKFVSPVTADHVSGNITSSNDMTIVNGETFYFHLNATGSDGCAGEYVSGSITAKYVEVVPLATTQGGHIGPQGAKLFAMVLVAALAMLVARHYLDLRGGRRHPVQNDESYV